MIKACVYIYENAPAYRILRARRGQYLGELLGPLLAIARGCGNHILGSQINHLITTASELKGVGGGGVWNKDGFMAFRLVTNKNAGRMWRRSRTGGTSSNPTA